ncbi:flagellin hook IN motif-containing protein, partial [Thiospirillum jenense]
MRTNTYGNNYTVASGAVASNTASGNGVTAGAVNILGHRGQIIGQTGVGASGLAIAASGSAQTMATNINKFTDATGVTATARTEAQVIFGAAGNYTLTIQSDNTTAQTVTFNLSSASTSDGLSAAVTAINDQASKTGVTAVVNEAGSGIVLANQTGNDIVLRDTVTTNAADVTVNKAYRDGSGTLQVDTTAVTLDFDNTVADYTTVSGYIQ